MKQLIERLRELEAAAKGKPHWSSERETYELVAMKALPQLLDRLEKLEAVAEAARYFENVYDGGGAAFVELQDALAALEGAHSRQQAGSIPLNKKGDDND